MKQFAPYPFFNLIVIGVSTGGPSALGEVIPKLKASIPVPILLVQHMPVKFTAAMAESLNSRSDLRVKEVEDGEVLLGGTVYVAQGGSHFTVIKKGNQLLAQIRSDIPPVNSCKPSVDVLFQSVAEQVPKLHILSLIMTGMGEDGKKGVEYLKGGMCWSLAQSKETCIVWGMPRAIEMANLADEIIPLTEIASRVNSFNYRSAL